MYREALVEVNDNGEKYISHIPWSDFIIERILNLFGKIDYQRPFSIRLLMPWEWEISKS
jgi:hypothetical protein